MNTARTTHGCIAEDFALELSSICGFYISQMKALKALSGIPAHPEFIQRNIDVAESFILATVPGPEAEK